MSTADVRNLFPVIAQRNTAYFASCSYGPLSVPVKEALQSYMADWEEKGMNWDLWMEKYEELRREIAALIGATADEIAIVPNVSSGLASVASALKLEGKSVVLSDLNFPTVGHVWLAQRKRDAQVKIVRGTEWKLNVEDLERAIEDNTLVLSEPHVCYQNGFKYSSVRALSEIAHKHGALMIVDDAQSTGVINIDVKKEDVDVMVTTTLKYLMGGAGLGILYVRKELIEELEPLLVGWFSQQEPFSFDIYNLTYSSTARRFESGTPAVPTVITSLESVKFVRSIGVENIEAHVKSLVMYATRLGEELGLDIISPKNIENMGPMFVFRSMNPHKVAEELAKRRIIVSPRGPAVRVAMHIFNTKEDIEKLFENLMDMMRNRQYSFEQSQEKDF
ncbi:MAG: aminotransferase class V-fold PLP-dependent enzyme [Zestosphaera sp.]